ncbi:MAG: hypothetical protein ACI4M6_04295 [Christensenellaceae bacterium]
MKTAIFSRVKTLIKTDGKIFTLNAYQTVYLDDDFTFVEFIAKDFLDGCYYKERNFSKNVNVFSVLDIRVIVFELSPQRNRSHTEFFKKSVEEGFKQFEVCNYLDGAYKLNVYDRNNSKNIELPFKAEKTDVFFKNGCLVILLEGARKILFVFNPVNLDVLFQKVCDEVIFGDEVNITVNHFTHLKHRETVELVLNSSKPLKISRTVTAKRQLNHPSLIGVAFLEEIKIRGDIKKFLGDEIALNADNVYDFFGDFSDVIYLNNLGYENTLGVLYPDCIKVFRPFVREGKIVDFSLE